MENRKKCRYFKFDYVVCEQIIDIEDLTEMPEEERLNYLSDIGRAVCYSIYNFQNDFDEVIDPKKIKDKQARKLYKEFLRATTDSIALCDNFSKAGKKGMAARWKK